MSSLTSSSVTSKPLGVIATMCAQSFSRLDALTTIISRSAKR